jgi:cyclopropane-fatty-acyl-phospholipid synthase
MMTALLLWVGGLLLFVNLMILLYVIHFRIRNAAIVDVGWGTGLAVIAGWYALMAPGDPTRRLIMFCMVALHGLRLSLHLYFARIHGQPEEGRYVQMRRQWGADFPRRLLRFYQSQAVAGAVLSLPFLLAALNPAPGLGVAGWLGLALYSIGLIGEGIADAQLRAFKSDPANRGKVCAVGLWMYSRHPNYFFQFVLWVGYSVFAVGAPFGWLGFVSPVIMLYFLLKVTGIPPTEEHLLRSRGDAYREYQRTTSAFMPWFPADRGDPSAIKRDAGSGPLIYRLLEHNLFPDRLIRWNIRRRHAATLRREEALEAAVGREAYLRAFTDRLRASPIAVETAAANEQHYEVPTKFFQTILGPRLKYSSGYWLTPVSTLAESEEAMLALSCERGRMADGLEVLELGCGWGALSLYLAERYPQSRVTAVSNSRTQKAHIDAEAARRGLTNVRVITANMAHFEPGQQFDRIFSVEMFEHMRNWPALFARIASWMRPDAVFFLHIFAHHRFAYLFDAADEHDWMSRHFFSGGMMPSDDLVEQCAEHLRVTGHWRVDGTHYQRTLEAWLAKMDAAQARVENIFARTYGPSQVTRWWVRWRVFFMACAELFGYRGGSEWIVSHYALERR